MGANSDAGLEHDEARAWAARGERMELLGRSIFVVDVPSGGRAEHPPLLIVHGFPTSSLDFAGVVDRLAEERRVVLLDLLGYGLSEKPDLAYTLALQADLVVALTSALGLDRLSLLTHDMGDTVGGELLARQMEGSWPVEVTGRVVTNGSIYIAMANLTAGQQFLLELPDERLADGLGPDRDGLAASLVATLSPDHAHLDLCAHAELVRHAGGAQLLPRTIRYIEERRADERRYTGAIETHPSPLTIVWGPEDPIAVSAMADRLAETRPDATLRWMDGAGHYPQLETPDAFVEAVLSADGL